MNLPGQHGDGKTGSGSRLRTKLVILFDIVKNPRADPRPAQNESGPRHRVSHNPGLNGLFRIIPDKGDSAGRSGVCTGAGRVE